MSVTPGKQLRLLMRKGIVMMPGVFNASLALLAKKKGFKAAYISGAGVTNAMTGFPDIGLITLTEMAQQVRFMANASKLPLICDADTGYGEVFNVQRTVQEMESAGAAGIHLEDQENPKRCGHLSGKTLVPAKEMQKKIRAAVQAKKDKNFMVIARTDARGVSGMKDALNRARLYVKAGADGVFPEALQTEKEFRDFATKIRVPLLANMTEFGKSPLLSASKLQRLGYKMVIFPMTAFRVMMNSAERVFADIHSEGTQTRWVSRMQTRKELYALLGYEEILKKDKKF